MHPTGFPVPAFTDPLTGDFGTRYGSLTTFLSRSRRPRRMIRRKLRSEWYGSSLPFSARSIHLAISAMVCPLFHRRARRA
jgi:hypothetical protein